MCGANRTVIRRRTKKMLTTKIIYPSGNEWTIPAIEVTFTPAQYEPMPEGAPASPQKMAAPPIVWVKRPNIDEIVQVDEGSIYVMNASGATVSTYHLGSNRLT
jgi:hypothetical protein